MKKGIWRTVGGRRIFIKDGQDLETAMTESGKFDNIINRNRLKKELKEALEYRPVYDKNIRNVTQNYIINATPNKGKIDKDKYFIDKTHTHEIDTVKFLYNKLGGYFQHIQEIDNTEGIKYPDFIWNNKRWEIKRASSKSTIDSNLRKAIHQIDKNGGVILDVSKVYYNNQIIMKCVEYRLLRSGESITCIVIKKNKIIGIISNK